MISRCVTRCPALLAVLLPLAVPASAEEVTVVRMTDEVLVEDAVRLGMHMSDMPKKVLVEENFEGTLYRQTQQDWNMDQPETNAFRSTGMAPDWVDCWDAGPTAYMILSGPDAFRTGMVQSVEYVDPDNKDSEVRIVLDRPFTPLPDKEGNNGILLSRLALHEGFSYGWSCYNWHERNDFSNTDRVSDQNFYVHDDVPPGSFGTSAMNMAGSEKESLLWFTPLHRSSASVQGLWKVRFWAKARAGEPTLRVRLNEEEPFRITPGDEWKQITCTFDFRPENPPDSVEVRFFVNGGDLLLDDVEIWIEGDTNPTAFRDDLVEVLQEYNPGVIRLLHNDGDTVANVIGPRLRAHAARGCTYASIKRRETSLHEFYGLCEYLDTEAWANLPGTMTPEDVDVIMEYLGAPADEGWGRKRAEWGHPAPWTESLRKIYVQFGNEAVTFGGTGFIGPDYWKGLIERAKASPYYRPNVVFVIDSQPTPRSNVLWAPNADVLCMNNYLMYGLTQAGMNEVYTTPEKLFRFVMAYPYWKWTVYATANEWRDASVLKGLDIEGAIYEGGNYHMTFGDASSEDRNRIVTSIGGQLAAFNSRLFIMKEYGIRAQNLFNLKQFSFRGGGSFGSGAEVRLWGHAINMAAGERLYRPGFLLAQAANRVIGGDLVRTVHEGADPVFTARGVFDQKDMRRVRGPDQGHLILDDVSTMENVPALYSYGFADGARRGLVLNNLDVTEPRRVRLQLDAAPAGGTARSWIVTADEIEANNEPEHAPQVAIEEMPLEGFKDGYEMTIPPFSSIAMEWEVAGER